MRSLALLAACALTLPAAAGWVRVTLAPVAGATAIRSGCVAAGQYERPAVAIAGNTVTIAGLPDSGRCYFALNAGPQDEWHFDFTALSGGRALPGQVRNLEVTPVAAPPGPTHTVTVSGIDANTFFNIAITGSGLVGVSLNGTAQFDWCGTAGNGQPSPALPTTPTIGGNNDNVRAKAVTFTAPAQGQCDADSSTSTTPAFTGAAITVGAVTKQLVQAGSTWSVSFP